MLTLLFLTGIGTGELILIVVVALIVLGPKRFPDIAQKMGRVVRDLRRTTDDLQRTFREEVKEARDLGNIDIEVQPRPARKVSEQRELPALPEPVAMPTPDKAIAVNPVAVGDAVPTGGLDAGSPRDPGLDGDDQAEPGSLEAPHRSDASPDLPATPTAHGDKATEGARTKEKQSGDAHAATKAGDGKDIG